MLNLYIQELNLTEDEELSFDREYFDILIILLTNLDFFPVKYLLFNIIHGLTFHSEECSGFLLTFENVSFFYNCLDGYNIKEFNFSLEIFANLLAKVDIALEEIMKFVPLEIKIKEILLSRKYENFHEILINVFWVLKLIVKKTNPESYVNVKNDFFHKNFFNKNLFFLKIFFSFVKFFQFSKKF